MDNILSEFNKASSFLTTKNIFFKNEIKRKEAIKIRGDTFISVSSFNECDNDEEIKITVSHNYIEKITEESISDQNSKLNLNKYRSEEQKYLEQSNYLKFVKSKTELPKDENNSTDNFLAPKYK